MSRDRMIARTSCAAASALAAMAAVLFAAPADKQQACLVARAVLPAATFRAGSPASGAFLKTLLVDLLAIPDPSGAGRDGDFFRLPFYAIESVHTELILVRLGAPLDVDRRLSPAARR